MFLLTYYKCSYVKLIKHFLKSKCVWHSRMSVLLYLHNHNFQATFLTLFKIFSCRFCVPEDINHTFAVCLRVHKMAVESSAGARRKGCKSATIHQSFDVLWPVKISFRKYWANLLTEILFDDDGQRWTTFLSFQIWSSIIFLKVWGRSRFSSWLVTMAQW